MNLEFDPVEHIGRVNGIVWPSTTQLLQEECFIDYRNVPEDRLEYKRRIGIRVGAATVMLDNGVLDEEAWNSPFSDEDKEKYKDRVGYLDGYRKFREIEDFEIERKEERYFSKRWRFHGAPDESGIWIVKHGTFQSLIDYKCTWKMYASTGPQLASYAMLLDECLGIKIQKRFGLLLKATGNYDLVPFDDPRDFTEFQAAVILHWARREKYKTMTEERLLRIFAQKERWL